MCAGCHSMGLKDQMFGFELTDVSVFVAAERLFCCSCMETVSTQSKAATFSKQFYSTIICTHMDRSGGFFFFARMAYNQLLYFHGGPKNVFASSHTTFLCIKATKDCHVFTQMHQEHQGLFSIFFNNCLESKREVCEQQSNIRDVRSASTIRNQCASDNKQSAIKLSALKKAFMRRVIKDCDFFFFSCKKRPHSQNGERRSLAAPHIAFWEASYPDKTASNYCCAVKVYRLTCP